MQRTILPTVALALCLVTSLAHAGPRGATPRNPGVVASVLAKWRARGAAERRMIRKEGLPPGVQGGSARPRCCRSFPPMIGLARVRPDRIAVFNLDTKARLSPDFESLDEIGRSMGIGFYVGVASGKKYAVDPEWGTIRNGLTPYDDIVSATLNDGGSRDVAVGIIVNRDGSKTRHLLDYNSGRRFHHKGTVTRYITATGEVERLPITPR